MGPQGSATGGGWGRGEGSDGPVHRSRGCEVGPEWGQCRDMGQQGAGGPKTGAHSQACCCPSLSPSWGWICCSFSDSSTQLFLIFLFRKHKLQVTHSLL